MAENFVEELDYAPIPDTNLGSKPGPEDVSLKILRTVRAVSTWS